MANPFACFVRVLHVFSPQDKNDCVHNRCGGVSQQQTARAVHEPFAVLSKLTQCFMLLQHVLHAVELAGFLSCHPCRRT